MDIVFNLLVGFLVYLMPIFNLQWVSSKDRDGTLVRGKLIAKPTQTAFKYAVIRALLLTVISFLAYSNFIGTVVILYPLMMLLTGMYSLFLGTIGIVIEEAFYATRPWVSFLGVFVNVLILDFLFALYALKQIPKSNR